MNDGTCKFCENLKQLQEYENRFHKPDGYEYDGFKYKRSVALVTRVTINGRTHGRTTDYMRNGNGYPLKYCPSCGRRLDDTDKATATLAEAAQMPKQEV